MPQWQSKLFLKKVDPSKNGLVKIFLYLILIDASIASHLDHTSMSFAVVIVLANDRMIGQWHLSQL